MGNALTKWGASGLAGAALAAGIWMPATKQVPSFETVTFFIAGGSAGELAPCGCTKPMSGGLLRLARVVRTKMGETRNAFFLEAGPITGGQGRQNELKAETVAEVHSTLKASAAFWGGEDLDHPLGVRMSVSRLMGAPLVNTDMSSLNLDLKPSVTVGGWKVFGYSRRSGEAMPGWKPTMRDLPTGGKLVVLTDFSKEEATAFAKTIGSPSLVVYRTGGDADSGEEIEPGKWVLSPGGKSKNLLTVAIEPGGKVRTETTLLDEKIIDDAMTARLYRIYLKRVEEETLLNRVPREQTAVYAGSEACVSCHQEISDHYKTTRHASALATLEKDGHDRDPDCVSCHVTGLGAISGYWDRKSSPKMANVGCESCHGPSRDHARDPKVLPGTPLVLKGKPEPKRTQPLESCVQCHTPNTSPNFQALTFWQKIRHPKGGQSVDNSEKSR